MTAAPNRRRAGLVEVGGVVLGVLAVWLLTMRWNWSVVPDAADPDSYHAPQSTLDWTVLYLVVVLAVGWLALRGRPVAGAVAVVVPLVVVSGWRMAAATVIGANLWPVGLGALTVTLAAVAAGAALVGTWLRRRRTR